MAGAVVSDAVSPDAQSECLFCRMVRGEIPVDSVFEDDQFLAFRDIAPVAPTHVLVIPKQHHTDIAALAISDPSAAGNLMQVAASVAQSEGLGDGFRLVLNTGSNGGQTVFHVHCHVLGGRSLTWPPG